jgi:hypothetical protein
MAEFNCTLLSEGALGAESNGTGRMYLIQYLSLISISESAEQISTKHIFSCVDAIQKL